MPINANSQATKGMSAASSQCDNAAATAFSGLEEVCERALPIWSRQIETARIQTEESISVLAARFSGLVVKLEAAARASKKVATISEGISAALKRMGNQGTSAEVLQQLLLRIKEAAPEMAESAESLQRESAGIRSEISDVLVSLQFQDRTSQILAQVRSSLDGLYAKLQQYRKECASHGRPEAIDPDRWLIEMALTYVTDEQRANHGEQTAESGQAGKVSFF